jgi:Animal haem peroxidase
MPRLPHGKAITIDEFREARDTLTARSADITLGFAAAQPLTTQDFGFLFPELQQNPNNLLPQSGATRNALVELGRAMLDDDPTSDEDTDIPAAYTYFGQFVDHDITLDLESAELPELVDPDLVPLSLEQIENDLQNARTATLELDSVYGLPAERDPQNGRKMRLGTVSEFVSRPPGKDDFNDVPREGRSSDPEHDRAALIGDARNDENTIIAQLHVAFLRAHNQLVDGGRTFGAARRVLRKHYQHIVLHDFLKRIADPQVVDQTIQQNRVYLPDPGNTFMPLEFSVAAYRFGHSMVRAEYDFNLNFLPADLGLLFTFTALSGQLGEFDTLPENWIIQWPNFVDVDEPATRTRRIDTKLVEPLFTLPDLRGRPRQGDRARLAVRNLLRGYLLRLPTGQAVARALRQKLSGVRDIPVLGPNRIRNAAASPDQVQKLEAGGFLERTPLWYYILAEAALLEEGQRLGPVGSTIVAEVLVGLIRRSENSILRTGDFQPTLPSAQPGTFTLTDLLRVARVLRQLQ